MNGPDLPQRCAVLIDGSALFFAIRDLYEGKSLDYEALLSILGAEFGHTAGKPETGRDARVLIGPANPGSVWLFWSPESPHNEGQIRFLKYLEEKLHIPVRRTPPSDSVIIDPQTALALAGSPRLKERLTRFDASISYMIGRLASEYQIIVISDSFALAEPLVRATKARWDRMGEPQSPNALVYFERSLDTRWHGAMQYYSDPIRRILQFVDLDQHSDRLFNLHVPKSRTWWGDEAPRPDQDWRAHKNS